MSGFEIHVALGKIYFMILLKPTLVKFFFYDGRYQSLLHLMQLTATEPAKHQVCFL